MTKILIVSPHCDDIALSLGATLHTFSGEKTGLILFSRYSHQTERRIAEERQAAKRLNYKPVFAGLPSHSNRDSDEGIREACRAYIQQHAYDLVIGPLALGNHPDHLIVKDLLKMPHAIFYEDIPYALRLPEIAPPGMTPQIIEGDWSKKLQAMKIYKSQIETGHIRTIEDYYRRLGGERFWSA